MTRCAACGKPAHDESKAIRVSEGKTKDDKFSEKKLWGVLHKVCFDRLVDSPDSVLAEIKKAASAAAVGSR